ncbi:MAG: hypothetical protein GXY03_07380 [Solirubrobacterales bacterium]|nr:hypothetical protein [Solirubrobacterales bacterium]
MNDQQPGQAGPGGPGGQPSEEELRAALEEQMRNIRVEEVVVQTVVTLVNLGAQRLGVAPAAGEEPGAGRDLAQAHLAIESVRALLPLCPREVVEQIQPALSQLQMVYAREAGGGAPAAGGPESAAPGAPGAAAGPAAGQSQAPPAPGGPGADPAEDERAKARSKIWTPPGT